jgi:hypothetical protein
MSKVCLTNDNAYFKISNSTKIIGDLEATGTIKASTGAILNGNVSLDKISFNSEKINFILISKDKDILANNNYINSNEIIAECYLPEDEIETGMVVNIYNNTSRNIKITSNKLLYNLLMLPPTGLNYIEIPPNLLFKFIFIIDKWHVSF